MSTSSFFQLLRSSFLKGIACCTVALTSLPAHALTDLADQPLVVPQSVPGNLALTPSVEWPTASTPAYLSTTAYASTTTYLGYFDPEKCYKYNYDTTTPANSYFAPFGPAAAHECTNTSSAANPLWSGNYLNWASTQTIDAFRWALTGGPRVVDTATDTILEKTNHSGQGDRDSIYPDKVLESGVSGATPFSGWTKVASRVHGLGTAMYFSSGQELSCTFTTNGSRKTTFTCDASSVGSNTGTCSTSNNSPTSGGSANCTAALNSPSTTLSCTVKRTSNNYTYSCSTNVSGSAICTASTTYSGSASANCNSAATVADYTGQSSTAGTASGTTFYKAYIRIKVCDPSVGLETNCKQYGSNYKPEGLMQQYAMKVRYSVFGYLNDSNDLRDGGVMRARMKYIGPNKPVPGSADVTNSDAEWDASTGIMSTNPDSTDASVTASAASAAGYAVPITNSGVMNYLNKFGKVITGDYKSKDPVSELYYAAQRYFRNLGNVSTYSDLTGAGSTANMTRWLDGFPVISTWDDPILYSCQKNFILGIGDVNTWNDANIKGGGSLRTNEPTMPATVSNDDTVAVNTASKDAKAATDMVGTLEGISNLGSYTSGRNNSFFIAGLAYDAHTTDIRPDATNPTMPGKQTINTYWLDVMEGQTYQSKNQYWLTAKYGGFDVPANFAPYASTNGTGTLTDSTWHTTNDLTPSPGDKRPDNYFLAKQADKMVAGLTGAFQKIVSEATSLTATAFSATSAQIRSSGLSYASSFNAGTWSGTVTARTVTYDANGNPVYSTNPIWDASNLLAATVPNNRKIITCCTTQTASGTSTIGTGGLRFQAADMATISPATNYSANFINVPNVPAGSQSASAYLAYLRGDHSKEANQAGGVYRIRNKQDENNALVPNVLGDIVDSKVNPVGIPNAQFLDGTNAGYSDFRKLYKNRNTVVYVGANDGMMHAFDGSQTGGSELFAYIPGFTYGSTPAISATTGLASLGNPLYTHHYFVNATPRVFDIDMTKTGGTTQTTAATAVWKSVLIGGLGKGGQGYYAIDVTNPTPSTSEATLAGQVLWEFTDSKMGYSYGDPVVVKTKKYGWVVIFTSGYNNADGVGYFFIVNPSNGALLEKISTGVGSTATPAGLAFPTAYVADYTDFTSDAVYAGDLLGNVWRVDLTPTSGSYSATKIATLADDATGAAQPITTRPLIEIQPSTLKRYVLIGTGRWLGTSDTNSTQLQAFYAIADGTSMAFYTDGANGTLPTGGSFPITRSDMVANTNLLTGIGSAPTQPMGWYFDLSNNPASGIAERITIDADSTFGLVAFAANLPGGDACNPSGTNRVFAVNFATGKSVLKNSTTGAVIASSSGGSGVATDVKFYNVDGRIRLQAGSKTGDVVNMPGTFTSSNKVMGMNWRGLPTTD